MSEPVHERSLQGVDAEMIVKRPLVCGDTRLIHGYLGVEPIVLVFAFYCPMVGNRVLDARAGSPASKCL